MKKLIISLFALITALFAMPFCATASTLDSINIYLKYDTLERIYKSEHCAPTSITDAGEERIDTYSGGVSYTSEELNLPGKGGFDVVVGKRFNSMADIDLFGDPQYVGVSDNRDLSGYYDSEWYMFPYHLNADCSDEPVYIGFYSIWHMLEAEGSESNTITLSEDYADELILYDDVNNVNDSYAWELDSHQKAGFSSRSKFCLYKDVIGEDVTLYRDTSKDYALLGYSTIKTHVYLKEALYRNWIRIGCGWEYDVPVITQWDSSTVLTYDCIYGMFYDSYQKENVSFRITYSGKTVKAAECYYLQKPVENPESPVRKVKGMYEIDASIEDDVFYYTITRIDGTEFYFIDDRLQSMTDKFGNTIYYNMERYSSIIITDTLDRVIELKKNGIWVKTNPNEAAEQIVNYAVDIYNDSVKDPNDFYEADNSFVLTAQYKVNGDAWKNIVYNHSMRARVFSIAEGSESEKQKIGYNKIVLDSVELPTGAKRIYNYAEFEKPQLFFAKPATDFHCIERYDLQADSTKKENHQQYEYGEITETPTTVTSFPGRDGYSVSETFDSEGMVTTRLITCSDVGYTVTENYTYAYVDGSFYVAEESVTKESTEGEISGYVKSYSYDNKSHNITQIKHGSTTVYTASYSNELLNSEYYTYDSEDIRGISNTIRRRKITQQNYKTKTFSSDSGEICETVIYTYDAYGNVASMTDENLYVEYTYEYADYSGTETPDYSIIITETYPHVSNMTDSQGNILAETDISKTSYYDKWGNLVKTVDGEGYITQYTYDCLGRVLTVTNPDNTTKTYRYADSANKIYITNEDGSRNMVWFDSFGREHNYYYYNSDINAYSAIYLKRYNAYGQMRGYYLYSNRAVDSVVRYTYYSDGSLKSEIVREGESTSGPILAQNTYTYTIPATNTNAVSVTRKMTNTQDVVITNYTNQYGYKIKDTVSDSTSTVEQKYTVDYWGNIIQVNDFNNNKAYTCTYDYRGRILTEKNAGVYNKYEYTGPFLVRVKNQDGRILNRYQYNSAGMLIFETSPVGDNTSETNYYRDRNGNLTKTVQSAGDGTAFRTTANFYDNRNRLIAADDGSGYYTRYEYDDGSRIVKMATGVATLTEQLNRSTHSVTDYAYSDLGHLTAITDAMGYTESYTPSSRGTVLSFTDKNGTVFDYTYDGLYRLLDKTATGTNDLTQSISYEYDYLGNLTQTVDENGTTLYTYDKLGNLLTQTRGTLVTEYEYDANGNRTSIDITDTNFSYSAEYTYYTDNRLKKVKDSTGYTNYEYNNRGAVEKKHTYDNDGKVKSSIWNIYYPNGTLEKRYNYTAATVVDTYKLNKYILTYHADGNIATVSNNNVTKSYEYDNAGRLSSESVGGTVVASYTYDKNGNRASMTGTADSTTYSYNKNNCLQYEGTYGNDGTYLSYHYYAYDKNGNLIEENDTGTAYDFSYNLFGNVTRIATNNTTIASYSYDGNGIRTSKTVNGVTTGFINDGSLVVGEVCGDSTVKYTYGNELISINNNGTIGYYHTDWHGNVTVVTDINRTVVANYEFDAFGNETLSTDSYYNPMRYCGEYLDSETGLIYLRARYYNPANGRFISEDPIKDGTNWYVYCGNNPVAFVDPSGKVPVDTIIDFASLGWSLWDFMNHPSLENFGYLAWDAAALIIPYAPGSYVSKADDMLKAGTKVLSKIDDYTAAGVWALNWSERGYEIEKALGGMGNNFPKIDKYVSSYIKEGVNYLSSITSIKSINITNKSYLSGKTLYTTLKKYVDDLAYFGKAAYKNESFEVLKDADRILEIAIPPVEMNSNQIQHFEQIMDYAEKQSVQVIIRIVE